MDAHIGSDEVVKAAGMMAAGASVVSLPGVKQVIEAAAEMEHWKNERQVLADLLQDLSPQSRQLLVLQELGIDTTKFPDADIEVLPIRKRPLKPAPRGRDELVKRQKKAR